MGKSTTAQLFAEFGCAVWDADAAVHRLYNRGGAAVAPIAQLFPQAIEEGAVSRQALRQIISEDPSALRQIEQIVHPLVAADRAAFLTRAPSEIMVLDIPLLFETNAQDQFDAVACVTVPEDVQRARVLSRRTMTAVQFEQILAKQMPNEEKCKRADFVIETDTVEHARAQVHSVIEEIRQRLADA